MYHIVFTLSLTIPVVKYGKDFVNFFRVTITEDGKKALLTLANGDMRKVLNVLQSTWLAFKNVTEDNVYTCVGHPLKTDIENIVKWLLNDRFQTTYKSILFETVMDEHVI